MKHAKKLYRGKKTFFYILITKGWLFLLLGAGILFLTWHVMYGNLRTSADSYLSNNPQWGFDAPQVAQLLLLVGLACILMVYLRARVLYRHHRFELDEFAINVHRGLYFTHETTIPYHQISNVYIVRPYHYKIFGIARLDIITAADRGLELDESRARKFLIPVIDITIARKLSRFLLEKAAQKRQSIREDFDENTDDEDEEGDTEEDETENQ
ncbi:MAG: PH domain-containing protein [bacterium]|nr:PH domain-containing protein [bacterium]